MNFMDQLRQQRWGENPGSKLVHILDMEILLKEQKIEALREKS